MNEQLIKFIELCLMDGVISDKEREVIFRKSKEFGVPEDECEIILEGMIQQKEGEVQSKEVSVQTSEPVSNSFEEKKPDLIKREILNKQPELESSISKNDSKYIEIEKRKKELEEELTQCLTFEIVKKRKTLKELITYKSYDELQKTVESVINHIILTEKEHKKVKPTMRDFISLRGLRKENKKYIDRILLFLKKETPDYLIQNTSKEERLSIGIDPNDTLFGLKKSKFRQHMIPKHKFTRSKWDKKVGGKRLYNNILIVFKNSFLVLGSGIYDENQDKFFDFNCFEDYKISLGGFLKKPKYLTKNNEKISSTIGGDDSDGNYLNIFLKYLYGDKDDLIQIEEDIINKKINDQEVGRKKIETQNKKELEELDTIVSITKKLISLSEIKEKLGRDNKLMNNSIQKEKLLNNLPNQTYGSVIFYNELNKNSTLFDNSHLNKITRFLNFIKTHEDKYLRLYEQCVGLYIDDPNNNCFNELINKLETINHYYEIMKSLVHNVNKDKVLYNKLYNLIEDEGIFMTKTEKESLNYMKKVSSGVIELNKNIVNGFNILESQLSDVSSGLYDLGSSLWMINSSLDDIYMNLPDNRGR